MRTKKRSEGLGVEIEVGRRTHEWVSFGNGVAEVSAALNLRSELAQMLLFGLIATGLVLAKGVGGLIDLDEITIAELESKPKFIAVDQLRDWLAQHSSAPLKANLRQQVIDQLRHAGKEPGRNISWKEFAHLVRNECGGWDMSKGKPRPAQGFDLKTIQRDVAKLKSH